MKEYAEKHGIDPATARQKAGRGGYQTARKIGRDWFIDDAEPFRDLRIKTGKYKGARKKKEE
ncbi:hypothetical protein LJC60_04890 [Ruminococcaceae bacterium OttesenSCG-928-D13]|nr:hypothetical protein [Ruminococcaceae bacterium OttesenSCG-928-D13]